MGIFNESQQTWVLIADGAKAKICLLRAPGSNLETVKDRIFHRNLPSRELVSSERGRVFNSANNARSAMERPTDPHEQEKQRFAQELSLLLENEFDQYNGLILIAAPKMLGYLRGALAEPCKQQIIDEVDKDLTNAPPDKLDNLALNLIDRRKVSRYYLNKN